MSAVFDPLKIAVLYYFGDLPYWKLPEIATQALGAGFDGNTLRKFAAATGKIVASDFDPDDFDSVFREMGIAAPIPKGEARLSLATESAKRVLTGEANAFDEATHIRIHLCELEEPPQELQEIVSISHQSKSASRSKWSALENELRNAMYRFLECRR